METVRTIRIVLPFHLRTLAHIEEEAAVEVYGPPTVSSVLDSLEARYPVLAGTIRDHATKKRRPFLRFYACKKDFSNAAPDTVLPEALASGEEPLMIIGAIAGG